MAREIATEIEIRAPAQSVWDILVDFGAYPAWNPFLLKVAGTPAAGARIRFWFEMPRGFRAPACATVLSVRTASELRWAGGLPGLFRAEHYFVLEHLGEAAVRFRHGEIFSGALVPLAWPLLRRGGREVYVAMNVALRARAERGAARVRN